MHNNDPPIPVSGPALLYQLGQLMVRESGDDQRVKPEQTTSWADDGVMPTQPRQESRSLGMQLQDRVKTLWQEHIPLCIEVLLAPNCGQCFEMISRMDGAFERVLAERKSVLLERWTLTVSVKKNHDQPSFITSQWLINAVRSQLHFSQLSAWLARLTKTSNDGEERRRKLSREMCNFKKLESNCDTYELKTKEKKSLNVIYSIQVPGESFDQKDFEKPPTTHTFPITDIGNKYLKVTLESLPRLEEIPKINCYCNQPKRRASKEIPSNQHEEMTKLLVNLNLKDSTVYDDRMLTRCEQNGKHKCSCDEEDKPKIDERRLKEIAKYKRRIRKEQKLKKLLESDDSMNENDCKKETTSIPILQASRFDRLRAIGCYRNQTYLTLPASRIETKIELPDENFNVAMTEIKKTNTIATQTDDVCFCGEKISISCGCERNKRSVGSNDIATVSSDNNCDNTNIRKRKDDVTDNIIKRPKLKLQPIFNKLEKIVTDRKMIDSERNVVEKKQSNLVDKNRNPISIPGYLVYKITDYVPDSIKNSNLPEKVVNTIVNYVPDIVKQSIESKSSKIDPQSNEDYIPNRKITKHQNDESTKIDLPINSDLLPSPTEMEHFRFRFDSAASMVFHSKTGLPLTSSPAPLKRGSHCFDFDDSINSVSGIKSALFHPISPVEPVSPKVSPPRLRPTATSRSQKLRVGSSTGLLGTFEESALKGRLEPVSTVHGFSATLGASGSFCPKHKRLPVTVFFYALGGTNAPYMGHINLHEHGYQVPRSGTIQVSLFNPHGTLVKMFVVLYDLTTMPAASQTFLRQRTLYLPVGCKEAPVKDLHKYLRYLIHLRFMTSKSGKLYLHSDIRIIVSRKADVDAPNSLPTNHSPPESPSTNNNAVNKKMAPKIQNGVVEPLKSAPNRVFGGSGDFKDVEISYDSRNGVSYELRSFTYGPDNPKFSPR